MNSILRFPEDMAKEEKLQAVAELLEEAKDALQEVLEEYTDEDEENEEAAGLMEEALDSLEDCCGSIYEALDGDGDGNALDIRIYLRQS